MLQPQVLPIVNDVQWRQTALRFSNRWNFPNCVGAIDGKHCQIQKPANSGSKYFNHKTHFSIILMAVVDGDYRFLMTGMALISKTRMRKVST